MPICSANWARDIHTLTPSGKAAITHITQYTKPCTDFLYFCLQTSRANPRRLHQAGHKHLFLRMLLESAAHAAVKLKVVSLYVSDLKCAIILLCRRQTGFVYIETGHSPRRTRKEPLPWQLQSLAALGGAMARRLELPPLHPPSCFWGWARRGAACHLLLPCKCFSG